MRGGLAAILSGTILMAGPAHAAELCAWMTEAVGDENYREVELWLQADGDVSFFYSMKGEGMKEAGEDGSRGHSPGSGTFLLHPGEARKPWGFGMTLYPPAEIDILAEIRAWPNDVFAEEEPPLLTVFAFRRSIPEGEVTPPPLFAEKRRREVDFPPTAEPHAPVVARGARNAARLGACKTSANASPPTSPVSTASRCPPRASGWPPSPSS